MPEQVHFVHKPDFRLLRKRLCMAAVIGTLFLGSTSRAAEPLETVPFGGKDFTVTETEEGEKLLSWGQLEITRNWFISSGGVFEVQGEQVAVFYSGNGGNACGPKTILATVDQAGRLKTASPPGDCGDPSPAISESAVYFIPWLIPGESQTAYRWSPYDGMLPAGTLSYTPVPGTGWADLATANVTQPMDILGYEEIYKEAQGLLGDDLEDYAIGLAVASEPEKTPDGLLAGSGCIPHACGGGDALIVADAANRKLYLAQQDGDGYRAWPDISAWPEAARQKLALIDR
ncbi:MAG: hypothetical protein KDJ63_10435 [Nitratireductor sp.]|nr:hypothetical protein [Nitratireductor sp.]